MSTLTQEITMHYFEDLVSALGDRTQVELPNAKIEVHRGKATNIVISQPERTIDLSQGVDGGMLDGIETRSRYMPHDDERDTVTEMRLFPQNEGDIRFMSDLASAIRTQREQ